MLKKYQTNYKLSHLTWFKVGGEAEVFYRPDNISDLAGFLTSLPKGSPILTIGAGSNILIRDGVLPGAALKLGRGFSYINLLPDQKQIVVGASTLNYHLAKFCLENGIKGFEFLIGIPGTIGGGISMNAGAYGLEFKDIVLSIKAMTPGGEVIELQNQEVGFKYRSNGLDLALIFLEATFAFDWGERDVIKANMHDIHTKRSSSQPITAKTAGSTFANPAGYKSWELIDAVGMRGAQLGDAQISELHCNFLINNGNASAKELEELAEMAREKVYRERALLLEWEIRRYGNPKE